MPIAIHSQDLVFHLLILKGCQKGMSGICTTCLMDQSLSPQHIPFFEGSLKHRNQWEGESHEPSFSVPLAHNVLGRHNGKHSGPIWFGKMFSAHCAQGQWLHKAEGSRDCDSSIVNENSEPPLCGWQDLQWLSAMKNWPPITICYSLTEWSHIAV